MTSLAWFLVFFASICTLAYHRASLAVWATGLGILMFFYSCWSESSWLVLGIYWLIFLLVFLPFLYTRGRRQFISKPLLAFYRQIMPTMSRTEREALNAGTVGWEGDLFSGQPELEKLLAISTPQLTTEEQAFIDGPVETLCQMINDWDITHTRADLPPEMWRLLKKEGFFGLLIPKEYGGKGFSYYACSQVQLKVQARSVTVGTTVSVPNSLGPGELLLHYGTQEQKAYYLPRLASGEEVPCFALTSPDAGSDASAMKDIGVVCEGQFEGKKILGIRLNWNKRYITLAPIASVIGLAFKLYDPQHLLGNKEDIGITCALIPRSTPGISIGRRHFPLNAPFQNGPIQGKDVFIPVDWIIGGPQQAGQGWRMLMECLAGGRGVSLPALATSSAKAAVLTSGAYSRVRRQFKQAIVHFEGVAEVLANMAGNLYLVEAARIFILSALDKGEKPSVASAIVKYQVTERARAIGNSAMDIQGGKAIILGPKNMIGRGYESIPIAITVEGANILTRNMIIFGQGAMRCHPYILAEYEAARQKDEKKGLVDFDRAFFSHAGFIISNVFRTLILGFTAARLVKVPVSPLKSYFQQLTRFSTVFAMLADLSMIVYGKNLKRKETVSARLGDILSHLYLLSAVLSRYHQEDKPEDDLPLVHWAAQTCLYEIQVRIDEVLQNFPFRGLGCCIKALIFPWGQSFVKPRLKLSLQIAQLFSAPTETRRRLTQGIFLTPGANNVFAQLEEALLKTIAAEPVEKKVRKAAQAAVLEGRDFNEQLKNALETKFISEQEYAWVMSAEEARQEVIAVDDFAPEELVRK